MRAVLTDSEKYIDKWLREQVKERKGKYIKMQTDFETGLPDRLILLPGAHSTFAELKTKGKKPKAIQLVRHAELRKLGQKVLVIDTLDKAKTFISNYDANG